MRIAIVGGGISGLGAAYALRAFAPTVFEADARLGGHAHTVTIDHTGVEMAVDTGFIAYNDKNYPNLVALFEEIGVATIASDMSFAVSDGRSEWSSNGVSGLFATRRNALNPAHLRMLADIVRFSTAARRDLEDPRLERMTIGAYVRSLGLGASFIDGYLAPMGAAIWSTPEADILAYPAASFLRFFDNHRLLHAKRPKWRTVKGGSRVYVAALRAKLTGQTVLADPVVEVRRLVGGGVLVRARSGATATFDHVILACHSDQALALLGEPDAEERGLLSAVRYGENTAWLHRDPRLMPKRRAAWASWNYLRQPGCDGDRVLVSYWMNLLQDLDPARPTFVTLNPPEPPAPELTFGRFSYAHPRFDGAAIAAQRAFPTVQGRGGVWYAGAWLGNGFHEDGLFSGLAVAERLGGGTPWRAGQGPSTVATPSTVMLAAAAS